MQALARWIAALVIVAAALPATAGKVGFLDTQGAIRGVGEGRRQLALLDAWANQRSDQYEAIQKRVADLGRQLETQRPVASAETLARLERELVQAQRDLEDAGRNLRRDLEAKQRELLAEVATRVREIASEYAAANGFDAVFSIEAQPLIYIADSVVITSAVIRLYDERYPAE